MLQKFRSLFKAEPEYEGRPKALLLLQVSSHDFEPTFIIFCLNCQTCSPNKNKPSNLWHITSILVCCIFGLSNPIVNSFTNKWLKCNCSVGCKIGFYHLWSFKHIHKNSTIFFFPRDELLQGKHLEIMGLFWVYFRWPVLTYFSVLIETE